MTLKEKFEDFKKSRKYYPEIEINRLDSGDKDHPIMVDMRTMVRVYRGGHWHVIFIPETYVAEHEEGVTEALVRFISHVHNVQHLSQNYPIHQSQYYCYGDEIVLADDFMDIDPLQISEQERLKQQRPF